MITKFDVSQIHERNEEIRREVAANRLARQVRANRGKKFRLAWGLGWEFAR